MTSQGPNSPGAVVDDASVGTLSWSNTANAKTGSDGAYATASAAYSTEQTATHYLKATDFGFSIPSNAIITKISIEVQAKAAFNFSSGNKSTVYNTTGNEFGGGTSVKLIKGGVIVGEDYASSVSGTAVQTTEAYIQYPRPGDDSSMNDPDLGGQTWTPADINASNFGVAVSFGIVCTDATRSPEVVSVNHIRTTVYYTTPTAATVTTSTPTSITQTTATGGGNVTDDGGATITERGVCWSTAANPTTSDSKAIAGGTTGVFTSSITGLTASTTFHVRAYATNSVGTGYGSDVTFTTRSPSPFPSHFTS